MAQAEEAELQVVHVWPFHLEETLRNRAGPKLLTYITTHAHCSSLSSRTNSLSGESECLSLSVISARNTL